MIAARAQTATLPRERMPMPGSARILVACDDASFLLSTCDLLQREGYRCDAGEGAEATAELLRHNPYDLLICSPGMGDNGYVEWIRSLQQAVKGPPVMLITSRGVFDPAIRSLDPPVVATLFEPVEREGLAGHVRAAIQKARLWCALEKAKESIQVQEPDLVSCETFSPPRRSGAPSASFESHLADTLLIGVQALADIKPLVEALALQTGRSEACRRFNCPRVGEMRRALREAVDTLERTKRAFKSRELGELRRRLERIIDTGSETF
jgi:CheY-like chemotaxis protein